MSVPTTKSLEDIRFLQNQKKGQLIRLEIQRLACRSACVPRQFLLDNSAFAGLFIAVERELQLDRSKLNVNAGAVAIRPPWAATGIRLALTLLRELAAETSLRHCVGLYRQRAEDRAA
jgi:thiolase-like protein